MISLTCVTVRNVRKSKQPVANNHSALSFSALITLAILDTTHGAMVRLGARNIGGVV
jgi:hypothetical protein